jgi:carbon storage regulator CsrA
MLVVSRKVGEAIVIGKDISVTVERIGRASVRLGIETPCYPFVVHQEITTAEAVHVTSGVARSDDELPCPSGL